METAVKEQVAMLTQAIGEAARYGKCPADVRGALLRLMAWLRSDTRDFIEWAQATNYAHGEYLNWYSWITQEFTRPLADLDGLTGHEYAALFFEAGNNYMKRGAA